MSRISDRSLIIFVRALYIPYVLVSVIAAGVSL